MPNFSNYGEGGRKGGREGGTYLLGVLDRVLDQLLQLALDALPPTDVVPVDVGHLTGGKEGRERGRRKGEGLSRGRGEMAHTCKPRFLLRRMGEGREGGREGGKTYLDDGLAEGRGVGDTQGILEVLLGHGHGVQDLREGGREEGRKG